MLFKKINVKNLQLDLENPRYPNPPENQRQAIEFMLQLQGDKLLLLAEDIIDHGLDPSERLVVVEDEEKNLIVVEGNRRLTTLKLLQNINMVNEEKTTKKIKKLLVSNPQVPKEVDCVVYSVDDERYEHWINLKHTGENNGIGRVRWKGQETDRHRAKHGESSFANQLLNFASKEADLNDSIRLNKHKLKITNITRLLGDPAIRERFNLQPINSVLFCNSHKSEFITNVTSLFEAMLETDDSGKVLFTVDRIRKKHDRKDFVDQLGISASNETLTTSWKITEPESYNNGTQSKGEQPKGEQPKGEQPKGEQPKDEQPKGEQPKGEQPKDEQPKDNKPRNGSKLAPSPSRNVLIPVGCKLNIPDKKCSGLFRELKSKLNFEDHEYSISVLIRVFLELSLTHYMDSNKDAKITNPKKTGLHDKVVLVAEHLRTNNGLTGPEATAIKSSSSGYFKADGAAQQYVHNKHALPDKRAINTMWDNLEPLFKGIWK